MLRIISIGNDRNIFNPQSGVAQRMVEYGTIFGELHVVVLALANLGFHPLKLSNNVFVYPTNSASKLKYIFDAIKIGKELAQSIYFGQTVISTQDPYDTGPVGIALKRKFKLPLQIQIHTDIFSKQFYDGSILNWLRFQVSKWTLRRADGIRVVRKKIAQDLIDNFKIDSKKVTVLPVFVDIKKIHDSPISVDLRMRYRKWNEIVLVASRLSTEKRIDVALMAFAQTLKKFPKAGMVIVGHGGEESRLMQKVQRLKLSENVVFEPWQQDLSSYYKTATLFQNTSDFEGFGMTLIEAAASGCTIVTTKVGVAEDMLQDGRSALICPIGDERCLATKLEILFENPAIAKSLSSEALKAIEVLNFSKEEYLNRYLSAVTAISK